MPKNKEWMPGDMVRVYDGNYPYIASITSVREDGRIGIRVDELNDTAKNRAYPTSVFREQCRRLVKKKRARLKAPTGKPSNASW